MVHLAEEVAKRSGAVVTMVTGKGSGHNAATACSEEVLDNLGREVDLVVTGSAD